MRLRIVVQLVLGGLLALALASFWKPSLAQRDGTRYFPETGHSVQGGFLGFYESIPNAELILGYPISRQFEDEFLGRQVQYFQRARLELLTDADKEPKVVLSPLGEFLYNPEQNRRLPAQSAGCRSIKNPETGQIHQVCYSFLDFFEAHGGVDFFGYPVSDFEISDERIVQHFQNAILSWHPELSRGQKVQLVDVGPIYFYKIGENRELLNPGNDGGDTLRSLLNLRVRAFTEKALVTDGDEQSLYVVVQDQKLQPVEGAQVKFTLTLPDGETMAILMPPTDENGITMFTMPIETGGAVGQGTFEVIASILNHESHTSTSFRIWW